MNKTLTGALALLLACSAQGETLKLRLLETADLHANMMNFNYFTGETDDTLGFVKTATLIRRARAEAKNSLLVENGDLLQGTALGDYVAKVAGLKPGEVHPVFKALNLLDYQVGNLGNHDFNFGLPFLLQSLRGANFPYISANLFVDDGDGNPANDKPLLRQYLIKDYAFIDEAGQPQHLKVGFIGFVPPQILQWDAANLKGKVEVRDMVDVARELVPKMKAQGADIIIAIPHAGLNAAPRQGLDENAGYYLSQVPGIDALLLGHAHADFPGPRYAGLPGVDMVKGTINGVAAVMPGFWGNHLGVLDLTLDKGPQGWRVLDSQSSLRAISRREQGELVCLVPEDKAVAQAVAKVHAATQAWVAQPLSHVDGDIQSYFALVQDSPAVQLVNDAQRWYLARQLKGGKLAGLPILSAAAPFRAGSSGPNDYSFVPKGDIAYRNVADLYLYPNTAAVLELSGAEVREWLERSAGLFNQVDGAKLAPQELLDPRYPSFNFDVIDGVSYRIDLSQPSRYDLDGKLVAPDAHRIQALSFKGKPIDPRQHFLLITNNYRAGGGGHFPGADSRHLVMASPDENRQILTDFLQSHPGYQPEADGNWQLSAGGAKPDLRFWSSADPKARAAAQRSGHLEPRGEVNDKGYGRYRYRF
ncbi:bifunctional 2',3'-cyclic-nucleotide 2'-phosphodiesterase/3'-nucleotidase [Gallaecimonas kandeliae]|uniref:bifunctional 2',3'-cyclic-nucleotide 2'-phosphodiesterase/3'-nucleotidase n=1 Tax=Gallaecimonas kandeliae TaxID=3029055 RepID=UPI0026484CFB|nr:bifunctional 2',3'-cyclic-nucleotide 2'-phosphodiesterase/3'-nucleotidase [Gallaecimonas kandeliae]WKE66368.1 bifunctional 2',3'-cyclic-nucleotide 2'-phosphodiesterase/3'-nucleotidase [Gallaecimonas kandeliae]